MSDSRRSLGRSSVVDEGYGSSSSSDSIGMVSHSSPSFLDEKENISTYLYQANGYDLESVIDLMISGGRLPSLKALVRFVKVAKSVYTHFVFSDSMVFSWGSEVIGSVVKVLPQKVSSVDFPDFSYVSSEFSLEEIIDTLRGLRESVTDVTLSSAWLEGKSLDDIVGIIGSIPKTVKKT